MNPTDLTILRGPRITPIAADEIPAKWLHQVRGVIVRDGHKLRAGFPACIEIEGPRGWQPLQLPNNGIEFVGLKDRNTVLRLLNGSEPLPEIPEATESRGIPTSKP